MTPGGDFSGDFKPRNGSTYLLQPGFIYFSGGPSIVRTVLGSCVSVCIWDKRLQYGGANHFLQPFIRDPDQATPHYGNVATTALIKIMEEAGCRRRDMVAHIFGGGYPETIAGRNIGEENVDAARNVLAHMNIRIVSEDVGGAMGRKIAFDISTGNVAVLKVQKIRSSDWYTDA